jgi:hypothetical protein
MEAATTGPRPHCDKDLCSRRRLFSGAEIWRRRRQPAGISVVAAGERGDEMAELWPRRGRSSTPRFQAISERMRSETSYAVGRIRERLGEFGPNSGPNSRILISWSNSIHPNEVLVYCFYTTRYFSANVKGIKYYLSIHIEKGQKCIKK